MLCSNITIQASTSQACVLQNMTGSVKEKKIKSQKIAKKMNLLLYQSLVCEDCKETSDGQFCVKTTIKLTTPFDIVL